MKTLMRLFVFFGMWSGLLIAGCDNTGTPSQSSSVSQQSAPAERSGAVAVVAKSIWPPLPRHDQNIVLMEEDADVLAPSIYFILDASGSMNDSACGSRDAKIDIAKKAIQEVFATLDSNVRLGLAVFDRSGIREVVAIGNGPENRQSFMDAIQGMRAGGGTPLKSAVKLAYGKINAWAQQQLGYGGYYRLAIVTDGDPDSFEDPREMVDKIFSESPIDIMTIGFCIGNTHALNQPGKTTYLEASDYASLRKGLRTVLAEAPGYADTK